MLGFDSEYPAMQLQAKFWRFLVKNCKKSAIKYSIEKPILLTFVSLSQTFCPRLSEETVFLFLTWSRPLDFTFSEDFSIWKGPFALQIDF